MVEQYCKCSINEKLEVHMSMFRSLVQEDLMNVYDMLLPFIISATSVYHICYYRLSYLLLLFIIYVTSVYHICYFCLSYLLFPFIISVASVNDICYIPTLKWMFFKACRNLMYIINKLRLYNRRANLIVEAVYRKRTSMAAIVMQ
jgi:hypothetical protein